MLNVDRTPDYFSGTRLALTIGARRICHAWSRHMDKLVYRAAALSPHDPRLDGPGFSLRANRPSL